VCRVLNLGAGAESVVTGVHRPVNATRSLTSKVSALSQRVFPWMADAAEVGHVHRHAWLHSCATPGEDGEVLPCSRGHGHSISTTAASYASGHWWNAKPGISCRVRSPERHPLSFVLSLSKDGRKEREAGEWPCGNALRRVQGERGFMAQGEWIPGGARAGRVAFTTVCAKWGVYAGVEVGAGVDAGYDRRVVRTCGVSWRRLHWRH